MLSYLSKFLYVLPGSGRGLVALLLVFTLSSSLEMVGIGAVGPFLWLAAHPEAVQQVPLLQDIHRQLTPEQTRYFIPALGIALAVLFCLKALLIFVARFLTFQYSLNKTSQLRSNLLRAYLAAPYTFYLNRDTAGLINNMMGETENFCHRCMIPLLEFTAHAITIVLLFLMLARVDLTLLLLIGVVLLPLTLLFYLLKGKIREWGKQSSESFHDILRVIQNSMGGIKETQVIGCQSFFEQQMDRYARRNAEAVTRFFSLQALPRVTVETLLMVLVLLLVALADLFLHKAIADILAILTIFAVASVRLIPAINQLAGSFTMLQASSYALDMLYHDLRSLEAEGGLTAAAGAAGQSLAPPSPSPASVSPIQFVHQFELKNLTYRYRSSSQNAIEGISLTVRKGESIAFIGKSGAGKTTLVDVMLGLLQPTTGDLEVDGVSVYSNLRGWQDLIGYIPQTIFLCDGTIEQNIAFGVPDALIDRDRVTAVARIAQLSELLEQLPEGLQTSVGERGVRLSGGQRQRVGIARALYHGREILILDEATAALDNETESLVTQAIQALAGVKTMIIIAHRLTTVKHCDRIYQIDCGRVVKVGTYAEVVEGQAVR